MVKTEAEKQVIKDRLKSAIKRYECTGCGCKMTVLVSLHCNCGGKIKPIEVLS